MALRERGVVREKGDGLWGIEGLRERGDGLKERGGEGERR